MIMNIKSNIDTEAEGLPSADEQKLDVRASTRSKSTFWSVLSKIIYRIDRIFGDLTAIILGLGIVGLWITSSVLDRQTTDLTMLRPNIKLWFADAFNGHDAEFGRLELTWLPADNHIVVTLEDAEIRGQDGEILERFDVVRSTLAPRPELFLRPRLVNTQIKGGVITYFEDAEGRVTAGLGPPEAVGRVGPVYRSGIARTPQENLKTILQDIDIVQIENAEVYIRNEVSGIDLLTNIKSLKANFSNDGALALTANGTIEQSSKPMPFTLNSLSDSEFDSLKLQLSVKEARPDEIAPTKGRFWELRGLAAPVDLLAEIDFSRSEGLRSASVDVRIGEGNFQLLREKPPRIYPIDALVARASLAPGNERMDVSALNLKSPKLTFNSSGFLTQLGNLSDGDETSSPVFNLSFRNFRADMRPQFETVTRINALNLIGQADVDSRKLDISSGTLKVFDTVHVFDGQLEMEEDNRLKKLTLTSSMSGALKPDQFLSLWPSKSFVGARSWIDQAVLEGDITEMGVELNFDEAFFETQELTDERLKLRFGGENTTLRYMQSLPPATNVIGRGDIIGNRLFIMMESGQVDGIALTGGTVEIPKLQQKNGDIIIEMDGQGQMAEFLRLADFPPFEIARRYNIQPAELEGKGTATVTVRRALTPFLPRDQIEYGIKANFVGASAPFELGAYDITNGTISLDANKERVVMTGPVDIGPWRADMRWLETFGETAPLTQYGLSGQVDSAILDELGLASRTWFDGSAFVRIDAEGRGMDIEGATLNVDLTQSELSVERIWMKAAGEAATLTGQLTRGTDESYLVQNAALKGDNIDVKGRVELESDFKLRQVDLSKVAVGNLIDGAVKIIPDRIAGRLGVELEATYLDVSPWTEDLFAERQSNLDVPLTLQGRVTNLILDEFYPVTDSKIYFSHTGQVIETARLEALSEGEPLKLELTTRENRKRQFDVSIPDASKAVSAFLGLDNTSGGELRITANLPAAGEDGAYVGEADMRDFKVKEAPALAQLLSLASLTGLADTLSGGTMQFERFKLPFTILGDDIAIRDARLYGPALGMTADGDINLDLRVLDFDGTLVPAYTANSVLGDIPVLGDIFVQEKDGGLFALTYTISGPFEQTQIAVNPLSALTPGFLRGIFKRDRTDADDAMKDAIEDVMPNANETP